jgi:hypothetical protein
MRVLLLGIPIVAILVVAAWAKISIVMEQYGAVSIWPI